MKATQYIIGLIFLIVVFPSCQTEIDFEKELMKSKIVVSSFVANDSTVKVSLKKNMSINNFNSPDIVTNADVILFEDDYMKEQLKLTRIVSDNPYYYIDGQPDSLIDFIYTSESKAQSGKKYRIEVKDSIGIFLNAETYIPKPIQINSIDTALLFIDRGNFTEIQLKIKIHFIDPVDEVNYYRITTNNHDGFKDFTIIEGDTVFFIRTDYWTQGTHLIDYDPLNSSEKDDPNSILFGTAKNSYNIFSDEKINRKDNSIIITICYGGDKGTRKFINKNIGEFLHLKVQLHSISSEEYYYLSSIDNQFYNDDLPFVEPVPIYSNIENGLGIFAGYSIAEKVFNIGEYPIEGINYDIECPH